MELVFHHFRRMSDEASLIFIFILKIGLYGVGNYFGSVDFFPKIDFADKIIFPVTYPDKQNSGHQHNQGVPMGGRGVEVFK